MFGLRYSGFIRSQYENVHWRVEIAERGYTGPEEDLEFSLSGTPLTLTWEKKGDDFFVPIKASEMSMTINCNENFKYLNLFTSDPRFFRVSIFRNTKLYWRGFLVSDLYQEEFAKPPYDVEIKAVDGFNLLSSVPFLDALGNKFTTEKMSLWDIAKQCFDLLELDLDIADWSNIYAEGMDQSKSPLGQVYVETAKIYAVNKDATYRDALEIVLTPFTYQMFQSNGALHIRSVMSLYSQERPLAYYGVAGSGRLVTHTGKPIVTHTGEPLITTVSRDRVESMWDGFHVQSTAMLEIVPGVKNINVEIKNKVTENAASKIGFLDINNWSRNYWIVEVVDQKLHLFFSRSGNNTEYFRSVHLEQSSTPLSLKLNFSTRNRGCTWSQIILFESEGKEYYLASSQDSKDTWREIDGNEEWQEVGLEPGKIEARTFDMQYIPMNGCLKLIFSGSQGIGTVVLDPIVTFEDKDNELENKLEPKILVDDLNNTDIEISMSVADLFQIPNNILIYEIYLISQNGELMRYWSEKGKTLKYSLVDLLSFNVEKFRGLPTKRISGEMHTGRHVDLNSIIQDNKYLHRSFYLNSISIDARNDNIDCEFVELPFFDMQTTKKVVLENVLIKQAIKCATGFILHINNGLYFFDTNNNSLTLVLSDIFNIFGMYERENGAFVIFDNKMVVFNYKGKISKEINNLDEIEESASKVIIRDACEYNNSIYLLLVDPEEPFPLPPAKFYLRVGEKTDLNNITIYMFLDYVLSVKGAICVKTPYKSTIYDVRKFNDRGLNPESFDLDIIAWNDHYFATIKDQKIQIINRIVKSSITDIILELDEKYSIVKFGNGILLYSDGIDVMLWNFETNTNLFIDTSTGDAVKNIQLIKNLIYIIREKTIIRIAI